MLQNCFEPGSILPQSCGQSFHNCTKLTKEILFLKDHSLGWNIFKATWSTRSSRKVRQLHNFLKFLFFESTFDMVQSGRATWAVLLFLQQKKKKMVKRNKIKKVSKKPYISINTAVTLCSPKNMATYFQKEIRELLNGKWFESTKIDFS